MRGWGGVPLCMMAPIAQPSSESSKMLRLETHIPSPAKGGANILGNIGVIQEYGKEHGSYCLGFRRLGLYGGSLRFNGKENGNHHNGVRL